MAIYQFKRKDGSTRHRVEVQRRDGKWFKKLSFLHLDEAKEYEAFLFKENRKGAIEITKDARVTTVDEYWEVWSVENRTKASAGWKQSQDQMFRDYVSPVLGKMKLADVKEPEIGRVLNRMRSAKEMKDLARPGKRSEQQIDHVYSMLRKMFGDAVEYYRMLAVSPVSRKHHKPVIEEKESAYLEPADSWKLLDYVREKDDFIAPAIWLELLAGLRSEAAIALKWDCIFWDTNQILIRRAWKKKVKEMANYPKGKKWEYVPMVPALREYLEELWAKQPKATDFVCHGESGRGMLSPNTLYGRLKLVCARAGVPVISPHKLRHSCSELFVRQGASQEDVGRLFHHRHSSTTKRYMHRSDDRLREIASRVARKGLHLVAVKEGERSPLLTSPLRGEKDVSVPLSGTTLGTK